jgi:hypothetical protein
MTAISAGVQGSQQPEQVWARAFMARSVQLGEQSCLLAHIVIPLNSRSRMDAQRTAMQANRYHAVPRKCRSMAALQPGPADVPGEPKPSPPAHHDGHAQRAADPLSSQSAQACDAADFTFSPPSPPRIAPVSARPWQPAAHAQLQNAHAHKLGPEDSAWRAPVPSLGSRDSADRQAAVLDAKLEEVQLEMEKLRMEREHNSAVRTNMEQARDALEQERAAFEVQKARRRLANLVRPGMRTFRCHRSPAVAAGRHDAV